jgi:dipeptidyl aminopeptidase/acylaminoacyl peptidase
LTRPLTAQAVAVPPPDPRIGSILSSLEQVRGIVQTALSPNGRWIAWVVNESGGDEIDVAALSDPERFRRVTAASGVVCVEANLGWSPDSRQLAFTSDCARHDGQRDIYLTSFSSPDPGSAAAPERLTHLNGAVDALAFSPDGRTIGFLYVEGATRHPGALDAMKPPAGVIGPGNAEIQRVAAVEVSTDQMRTLSPENLHVYEFDWSPDSQRLAYVAAPPPGEDNWWTAKLYIQDLEAGGTEKACGSAESCRGLQIIVDPTNGKLDDPASHGLEGLQIAVPRWSPDGKSLAFIGGLMSDQGVTGGDIYLVPSAGGKPKDLAPNSDRSAVWIDWLGGSNSSSESDRPKEPSLLVSWIKSGHAVIGEISLNGGPESTYDTIPGSIGDGRLSMSLSVASSSRGRAEVAYIRSSYSEAPEIYVGELGAPAYAVTRYNDTLKPVWGKAESVEWENEGLPVQGWLLYPARYDPAKRYPLIVSVHGGPSSAVLPQWPFPGYNPIAFSALGYFVLMPNPRGSFGEGESFTLADRKDFGYGDLRDILAGVDAVSARLPIDPSRVGITGWSYGGFMTMFAVTQTHRFHAAVAGAGISDWQSYYGENSIDEWMIPFFGSSVYDDPAVYAKSSAIDFIKNAKTPTLLVVGDRDGECPAPQSFEFWHGLRAEHVPTELVVYPDEGHRFVSFDHRRDVMERALSWFEQYLPSQ